MLLTYNPNVSPFREDYSESRRLHFYDRGENIPLVADGVWQVYRGMAQLSQVSESGEEILLGWVHSSHFFGLNLTHLESYHARALSELYLKWYTIAEVENSVELTRMMLNQMIRRQQQTESLLAIAGLKRVEERLQQLLQLLKREMGEPIAQGSRLKIRLTHQNLANAIGTTRVTVTRLLGEFQRQGWVSSDRDRHLIIHG
ncbi:Crp/Fnr family transcriptional regulator [Microcystis aeruginosa]|uniref:Crp/Fnr family transcriptional regulator n=1 Tax=Microcystis aeruginosa TaxID=1126 RepID=UPI000CB23D3E|nr:Crp/Fnr family transcriptional regulator [Microcystis aeruginosa]MBE8994434.1 Crp/Fnr family transcriptional regulator [Microcystis aeruginosa LEGE 91341]MDB9427098.1 Crp/Fnr family transcriptional regulator [Microcystis aeruginosa CS-564/01]MDB9434640.1 Crp/Fnr family transcriptional regulator [Microcystis aeruginosa CS-552/01]GBE74280.1 transcriptional regulator [Microcystis aeruginosa NIES-87]